MLAACSPAFVPLPIGSTPYSLTGSFKNGYIVAKKDNGFLFYGPYYPINKGNYSLQLKGKFTNPKNAILDIVGNGGKKVYKTTKLSEQFYISKNSITIPFSIPSHINDIEVRLFVKPETELTIYGYSIKPITQDD